MLNLDTLRKNRNALFLALHGAGWGAYGIAQYLGALLFEKDGSYQLVVAVAAVSGFVLSLPLRYVYRGLWRRPPLTVLAVALPTCYVIALAWRLIVNTSYHRLIPAADAEMPMTTLYDLFAGAFPATYLLLCWSGLYFGLKWYESLQEQREAVLRASALAQEAQLKMLRYQLNPHFLFNTLNAISTLILDNQNRTANAAVTRLAEFLRYTLDQDSMKKVTMRQELEALDLYLGTERLRFDERLALEIAVEDAALDALVPSLLLQPLVENAVKYAVSPREGGGTIRIEARVREAVLEVAVADDGPGLADAPTLSKGRGVGLRNTRERLAVLYGDRHRFATLDGRPGLRIEMAFPLEPWPPGPGSLEQGPLERAPLAMPARRKPSEAA